jgi:hypothetical protein
VRNSLAQVEFWGAGQQAEYIQQPDNHSDHHYSVKDRLDGCRHWNVLIDQPEKHANDNQQQYDLNQRHSEFSSLDGAFSVSAVTRNRGIS